MERDPSIHINFSSPVRTVLDTPTEHPEVMIIHKSYETLLRQMYRLPIDPTLTLYIPFIPYDTLQQMFWTFDVTKYELDPILQPWGSKIRY